MVVACACTDSGAANAAAIATAPPNRAANDVIVDMLTSTGWFRISGIRKHGCRIA